MIDNFSIRDLRSAEYFQFMVSVHDIFSKHSIVRENSGFLFDSMSENLKIAEGALTAERRNEKVREKNDADRYRDRMHSKFFNYLKFILYDERDSRFDDAQAIMRVVKEVGNPTRLPENAQSAMMTALGARLEPLRSQMEAIDAQQIADEMMEANRLFITIERELRELLAAQKISETPASMSAIRKQIDPTYRAIVAGINAYTKTPSKKEEYAELISEMNVLIARYGALLAARKREKTEPETVVCEKCSQE